MKVPYVWRMKIWLIRLKKEESKRKKSDDEFSIYLSNEKERKVSYWYEEVQESDIQISIINVKFNICRRRM